MACMHSQVRLQLELGVCFDSERLLALAFEDETAVSQV